eukprot:8202125-Prorocentrum_lima.AAC.1
MLSQDSLSRGGRSYQATPTAAFATAAEETRFAPPPYLHRRRRGWMLPERSWRGLWALGLARIAPHQLQR